MTTAVENFLIKSKHEGFVLRISFTNGGSVVALVREFDVMSIAVEPYSLYGVPISPDKILLTDMARVTLSKLNTMTLFMSRLGRRVSLRICFVCNVRGGES